MRVTLLYIFIVEVSSGGGSGNRKAKGAVGKKSNPASPSAVNKEKQKEKEKRKEERQQQRKVLAEQNSLLLSRMADVEGPVEVQDENTRIPDNLLEDCMEILQSRPSTNATPVSTLLHPRQRGPPSTSETTPAHSNITPPSFTQSLVTPLQPREQEPPSRLRISLRTKHGHNLEASVLAGDS